MSHGNEERAELLLNHSAGGHVLHTAFIERLNGTMRQRLATLPRTCRHGARQVRSLETGMDLIGTTYKLLLGAAATLQTIAPRVCLYACVGCWTHGSHLERL